MNFSKKNHELKKNNRNFVSKTKLLIILAIILFQSCKTKQLQTKTDLPKIDNQITGELDYAKGGFELVQWNSKGDEITLGRIDKKGMIHFNLPEYDIKAVGKNHMNSTLEGQFRMLKCNGKGEVDMMGQPLVKTPFDAIYSQLYGPMFVKKYDTYIAYIRLVSDKKMLIKGNFDKITGNKYYWFYIDSALDYKDKCIRPSFNGADFEIDMTADMQFKKGWNFIKRNLVAIQNYGENNEQTTPKKIEYTLSSPKSKDVIWHLVRKMDEEKIQTAKIKYELATPSTKK